MDAIEHLNALAKGRNLRQENEDTAVKKLLAMTDPHYREPSHRDDDAVMFLASLTEKEYQRQYGER